MILAALIVGASFVLWVAIVLARRSSMGAAVLSPIFYFSVLWWLAFPLHAFLLTQGWVDTQQRVVLNQSNIAIAVWFSFAAMLVVYWGSRFQHSREMNPLSKTIEGEPVDLDRLSLVLMLLIMLAVFFLTQTVYSTGTFAPFIGNEQNEARVGRGPLFVLSELFIYGLIAAIPSALRQRSWRSFRPTFLLIFLAGLLFATYIGIVLTSRRVIVLPLFALALAWLISRRKVNVLLASFLILASVFATPSLQFLRYTLTPPAEPASQRTTDPSWGSSEPSSRLNEPSSRLNEPSSRLSIDPPVQLPPIASYCRYSNSQPTLQRAVLILDATDKERRFSEPSAHVAQWLCSERGYPAAYFIQNIASSFGLVDHLSAYLGRVTLIQFFSGVDYGVAWAYNTLFALVPRAVWPDKPLHYGSVAIQKWLYPHMYEGTAVTMTLPPSFIVDFIYGFGVLSLLILCFGVGRFLAWTHIGLRQGLTAQNDPRFVLSLFLMAYMFNLVRGGTGFVQPFALMLSVVALMYGVKSLRELLPKSRSIASRP